MLIGIGGHVFLFTKKRQAEMFRQIPDKLFIP